MSINYAVATNTELLNERHFDGYGTILINNRLFFARLLTEKIMIYPVYYMNYTYDNVSVTIILTTGLTAEKGMLIRSLEIILLFHF